MLDMQLLNDALVTVAVLIGTAITLAVTIIAAARVSRSGQSRPGQAPHGGIQRDLPLQPQPDADVDHARELVLL